MILHNNGSKTTFAQHESHCILVVKALLHEAIFFYNLQRNGFARQVAEQSARVTSPLRSMSRKEKLRCELQEK